MSGIVIRRVIISEVREGEIKRFDADGLPGEQFLDYEFFQQSGFTSKPRANSEGILFKSGGIVYLLASDDRDNRLALTDDGDVAIHTDKNNYVLIKAAGDIEVTSTTKVTVNAPAVELGNGTLKKLINEELVPKFNQHTHPTAAVGAPSTPTVPLVLADVATAKTTAS